MPDLASTIWRDFVTDGIPASGVHKPLKAKIREWATYAEANLAVGFVTKDKYGGLSDVAVRGAFNLRLPYIGGFDETPTLYLDPTAEIAAAYPTETDPLVLDIYRGNLVRDAINWVQTCGGRRPKIQLVNGFHKIDSHAFIDNGLVEITASAQPQLMTITGITFATTTVAGVTGALYTCTVTVSAALPSRVEVGFPIGMQNVKGSTADGSQSAMAANGAHKVEWIADDRLSFSFTMRSYGPALTTVTTLDNVTTLGMAANKVVVPYAAISASGISYDGSAIEGFLNVIEGGELHMSFVGLAYSRAIITPGDPNLEDDLLFFRGSDGDIVDCVLVGAPDKVVRLSSHATVRIFRSCLGGHYTSDNAIQLALGSAATLQRVFVGSFSVDAVSVTSNCSVSLDQLIIASSALGVRTTYVSSNVEYSGTLSHFAFCTTALQCNRGRIGILNSNSKIADCDNWALIDAEGGTIVGDPGRSRITNPNTLVAGKPVSGGGWQQNDATPIRPFTPRATLATISAGTTAPGGEVRTTFDYPVPDVTMKIDFGRLNGNAFQTGWSFEAFVDAGSGANKIMIVARRTAATSGNLSNHQFWVQGRYTA